MGTCLILMEERLRVVEFDKKKKKKM